VAQISNGGGDLESALLSYRGGNECQWCGGWFWLFNLEAFVAAAA
jgi:hypothetical protein